MHKCPIRGCKFQFAQGRLGWDAHVGSVKNHPKWHPEIVELMPRLEAFAAEHPSFFRDEAPVSVTRHKSGTMARVHAKTGT